MVTQRVSRLPSVGSPSRTGTVESFDFQVATGVLVDRSGIRYPFHCTAIADGSRDIQVGIEVAFRLVFGHAGRVEAASISPL